MAREFDVLKLIDNGIATSEGVRWPGGDGAFKVNATWNGATISLEYRGPNGSTWSAVGTDTTLTADGGGVFTLDECMIRAAVTGGPPAAVYATAGSINGFPR